MPTLRTVASPALAAGFRLAGLRVDEASSPREAGAIIERLTTEAEAGVILVQQDLFEGLADTQRRALERAAVPIIVPIPAPKWATGRRAAEEYILDLLQRAIGYRVRLQ
ncbi:MAG TPA: V-type ATP synthase subunit F [Gemmatimonadaceae bacterium]